MNTHPLLAGLRNGPDCMLQNLDLVNKRGLVLRVSERLYREASFLDDRMFTPQMEGYWFPLDRLVETLNGIAVPVPHFIFQVGHCGSTLISRLLAELPGNLPVREPMSLLTLAMTRRELGRPSSWVSAAQWQQCFELATRALARSYHPNDHAVIKVTSTAGNLLEALPPDAQHPPRLLLLYIRLESLLAVMLRNSGLRDNIHAGSPAWIADFCRLTGRDDIRLSELSDAQQVVIKWLTLMLLFTHAATAHPSEALLLDFDDFLKSPAAKLTGTADHFRLTFTAEQIDKLVSGPLMRSYSKIPMQTFNPDQREQELRDARRQFHDEIRNGLHWAEILCRELPILEATATYLSNGS
ncbi:MAG: hypothetical protein KGI32_00665 [Gammaproteobacteria bacterium]|nr:hypothetical protein [Gammaproteobacteria bacterium]MDE1886628.1 hypothetical protein [Gammaproteobacteria bacterium]MDE2023935.1 hypothetical protein [Gammaproteobacteria bacterium]MDE2139167.1 hypothetical protein [Gammaproteobacteria bacterium]